MQNIILKIRLVLALSFIIIYSCNHKDKATSGESKVNEDSYKLLLNDALSDYENVTTLLSYKHGISKSIAHKISIEHIKIYDLSTAYLMSDNKNNFDFSNNETNIEEAIKKLSYENGISEKTIAEYLFDLKLYMNNFETEY